MRLIPERPLRRQAGRARLRGPGLLALPAALALLAACAELPVAIEYRFPAGRRLEYRWTVEATTTTDLPRGTAHRLRLVLAVTETVVGSLEGGGAHLRIVLAPIELVEDGIEGRPGGPVAVELEVARDGRVVKVLRAADLPPDLVAALELDRLLSESRPPAPPRPVKLDDRWPAPLKLQGDVTVIDLNGRGRLAGFGLEAGRRLARLEIDRMGRLRTEQQVGRSDVALEGLSVIRTAAAVDLDRGILVESVSTAESTFDVSPGETSRTGTLKVVLTTRVELL